MVKNGVATITELESFLLKSQKYDLTSALEEAGSFLNISNYNQTDGNEQ